MSLREAGVARSTAGYLRAEDSLLEGLYREVAQVLDPELDESIVDLGFIESLQVDGGQVIVELHLPTFWCAPNFAYLMAHDIRARLLPLEGVESVTVHLKDHAASESVEAGVNAGKSFAEAFPGEAGDNLEGLRAIFLRKGFIRRQERFLRCLLEADASPEEVCSLRVGDVKLEGESCAVVSREGRVLWSGPAELPRLYLARRVEIDLDTSPEAPLFTDLTGGSVTPDRLQEHFRSARLVRASLEANTFMCQALLSARQEQSRRSRASNPQGG